MLTVTTPGKMAEAVIETIVAKVPKCMRDWAFVDYDESLTDEQAAAILAGDVEEVDGQVDDLTFEKRYDGIDYYLRDDVPKATVDALDEIGYLDELRSRLSELDTSDVLDKLIGRLGDKAIRVRTGHTVDPTYGDEELAELERDRLSVHLRDTLTVDGGQRMMTKVEADKAAGELIAEQGHYGGDVYVVAYTNIRELLRLAVDTGHGLRAEDAALTLRFVGTRSEPGPQIMVWNGLNGSGHTVDVPSRDVQVDAVTIGDVEPEFRNPRRWTYCDDCAAVYLPAFSADLTITH